VIGQKNIDSNDSRAIYRRFPGGSEVGQLQNFSTKRKIFASMEKFERRRARDFGPP
jgi:hypothetical protein